MNLFPTGDCAVKSSTDQAANKTSRSSCNSQNSDNPNEPTATTTATQEQSHHCTPSPATSSMTEENDSNKGNNEVMNKIRLPESLESLPRAEYCPSQRHRWNTNEEIAAVLINFDRHGEWLAKEVKIRPKSGSMLLYSRKKVRYRRDGYCWKKRKDGKTTREDHMKLKVQGTECIYGCYVHSAILPTFHRRCYWLLQNPDIVLVHYLNVPYPDDAKLLVVASVSLWAERKEWSKEELISQLRPMFFSEDEPNMNNELEVSTAETVEAIVTQLMEKQRLARLGAMNGNASSSLGNPSQPTLGMASSGHKVNVNDVSKKQEENERTDLIPISMATNNLQHSLRRLSTGSLIRLEPRPQQLHSASVNQASSSVGMYKSMSNSSNSTHVEQQYGYSTNKGVAVNFTSFPALIKGPILLNPSSGNDNNLTPNCTANQTQQPRIIAKQETTEYFSPANDSLNATSQLHYSQLNSSTGFAEFYPSASYPTTTIEAASADLRPSNELLSNQSYSRLQSDCLYNETLDLSHDDIQRTLSANLSHEIGFHPGSAINSGTSEDDLLVNFDAFDMLTDFPDLECHDTLDSLISLHGDIHHQTSTEENSTQKLSKEASIISTGEQNNSHSTIDVNTSTVSASDTSLRLVDVTDYSPEWASTEGGCKVLLTGPFHSPSSYTAFFGDVEVPAVWVQMGVLRCFSPPHNAGRVQLQLAKEGIIITNPVVFEYKTLNINLTNGVSLQKSWIGTLLSWLVARLELLSTQLDIETNDFHHLFSSLKKIVENSDAVTHDIEGRLVSICRQLVSCHWHLNELATSFLHSGMNLLHLAAALGLVRVTCTLLNWRLENSSPSLEKEINPLACDAQGYTPLMWACANGHRDVAALLAQWEPSALNVPEKTGLTVVNIARHHGHTALATELETREILNVRRRTTADSGTPKVSLPNNSLRTTVRSSQSNDLSCRRQMRMAKRSSVDNVTNPANFNDPSCWRRATETQGRKLSRNDRSFSLPLGAQPSASTGSGSNSIATCGEGNLSQNSVLDSNTSLSGGSNTDGELCSSPFIDVEKLSDDGVDSQAAPTGVMNCGRRDSMNSIDLHIASLSSIEQDTRVLTLAEQIIAAIPDRIKNERSEDLTLGWSSCMDAEPTVEEQTVEGIGDLPISDGRCFETPDFTFEFSDQNYRFCEAGTPSSSQSPASSSCLQSPCSFSMNSPSPPPTTADFSEFLQASANLFVRDFSNLTLSDHEQRELYEAAKIIQKAYRSYKGRKKAEEQEKERAAAVIIQNYYRRYKQYVYLKQMTKAAVVIQNQFRSYFEHKRFKKNLESGATTSSASTSSCISPASNFRNFRDNSAGSSGRQSREGTPTSSALKRTYSQRRQHQAARKIQQFMRQSKNKLQKERALAAEREKQPTETQPTSVNHSVPASPVTPAAAAAVVATAAAAAAAQQHVFEINRSANHRRSEQ